MTVYAGAVPTDADVIRSGSWRPESTRIIAKALVEEMGMALALLDTNADSSGYGYVNLYQQQDSGWRDAGGTNAGSGGSGWTAGVYFAYGEAPVGAAAVTIEFRGANQVVPVQNGWWLFAVGLARRADGDDARLVGAPSND